MKDVFLEYTLPGLLVALIFLAIVVLTIILFFSKTKKPKEDEGEYKGEVIWSTGLGVFIYHVEDNKFLYSKDGKSWENLTLPGLPKSSNSSISYSKKHDRFVIVLSNSVYTSLDGVTWTEECLPVSKSEKEALEIVDLIDQLRNNNEGNAVTLYHDNTDCWDEDCHNNRIDFKIGFTNKVKAIFGNSIKECLQNALLYKEEK